MNCLTASGPLFFALCSCRCQSLFLPPGLPYRASPPSTPGLHTLFPLCQPSGPGVCSRGRFGGGGGGGVCVASPLDADEGYTGGALAWSPLDADEELWRGYASGGGGGTFDAVEGCTTLSFIDGFATSFVDGFATEGVSCFTSHGGVCNTKSANVH